MWSNMTVKRGDIFLADLPLSMGSEQGGKRPVVIIQNNKGNVYSPTVIVAVITSKMNKTKLPTHIEINLSKPSLVMTEQIKTLDKSRLVRKLASLDDETVKKINNALRISLDV